MFGLGFWEIAVIMGVALLILGPTKLPELARSLGKTLREFRKATEDFKSTIDEELHKPEKPAKQLPSAREPEDVSAEEEAARSRDPGGSAPSVGTAASGEDPDTSASEGVPEDVERPDPGSGQGAGDASRREASTSPEGDDPRPFEVRPPDEPAVARTPGSEPR